jgi:hypothetical protein
VTLGGSGKGFKSENIENVSAIYCADLWGGGGAVGGWTTCDFQ